MTYRALTLWQSFMAFLRAWPRREHRHGPTCFDWPTPPEIVAARAVYENAIRVHRGQGKAAEAVKAARTAALMREVYGK